VGVPPHTCPLYFFTTDSQNRRLAFLQAVATHSFTCHTFTLNKASPNLTGAGLQTRQLGYGWVCRVALENVAARMVLQGATVVLDGSGEREFRKTLKTYLQRQLNVGGQPADYVAGVTNRLHSEKVGAAVYEEYLKGKRSALRLWP
jgi:hypothetical protein